MSDTVIQVENLGKRYRLGARARLDQTLPETIGQMGRAALQRLGRAWRGHDDRATSADSIKNQKSKIKNSADFWALRNLNFEVGRGQVLGIIGHNGAGKSTLLKILSQITDPTEGQVRLRGRVASLLEVGTGFHPELSGRENIYLNGSILGMTRREIAAKFDAIAAFAEVDRFLDTPVKHYSSGMYVRLAFAVAAHLEPELLIVDEVLAVGDAEFQRKCLGKMEEVTHRGGRTVLFVSHNMAAVQRLCQRAILLEQGQVVGDGPSEQVIQTYLRRTGFQQQTGQRRFAAGQEPSGEGVSLQWVRTIDRAGRDVGQIGLNQEFDIEVGLHAQRPVRDLSVAIALRCDDQTIALSSTDHDRQTPAHQVWPSGPHVLRCRVPAHLLNAQRYVVGVWVGRPCQTTLIQVDYAMCFNTVALAGGADHLRAPRLGAVAPVLEWEHSYPAEALGHVA